MAVPDLPADAPRVADGRYALLTRLGEGGMAAVYGAWDGQLGAWRAIKVLLPEHARRRSVRQRFEREARTLMAIRHPNLVRVHDVRADRALPYLVMDLLPGGSLEDWSVRHGPMPPALAVEVGVQVCRGLEAAHRAGVIHRDVKPQNVLVSADDGCCLTDFGVARVEGGGGTRANVSMGTVGYMAPEQLADSRSVDERSDVYALGASLYVLLTRRPVRDLFRLADDPALLGDLPDPLQPLLGRCLAYDRRGRWPSAAALREALEAARSALPDPPAETPPLACRAPSDAPRGGALGELTELEGLLEAPIPPPKRRLAAEPAPFPLANRPPAEPEPAGPAATAVVQVEPTVIAPTPPAAPGRAARPALRVAAVGSATLAMLLGLAAASAGLVATALVASGEAQVGDGAEKTAAAGRIVAQRVRDGERLLGDLERLGADPGPARSLLGSDEVAFARSVAAAARPVIRGRRDLPEDELRRQRLERVVWAVDHLEQAEAQWAAAAERPWGRLAVGLGLADGPPEGLDAP